MSHPPTNITINKHTTNMARLGAHAVNAKVDVEKQPAMGKDLPSATPRTPTGGSTFVAP